MASLRQSAWNCTTTGDTWNRVCTVSLPSPSLQGSLLVLIALSTHLTDRNYTMATPAGWTRILYETEDKTDLAIYYRQNASPLSSATVINPSNRAIQAQLLEFTGAAQSGALDKIAVGSSDSRWPSSGSTGVLSQADEIVVGVVANRYSSTTQGGFGGGLTKIDERVTPPGVQYDSDDQRTRMSVHLATPSTAQAWQLQGQLSTDREWVAALVTFRGGSLGPARMTSIDQPNAVSIVGGAADLTVFGPLVSTDQPDAVTITGGSAWIGPSELQMRLGGPTGLLIGAGCDVRIGKVTGLGGHDVRTSDSEFPRGDGAARGTDLQSSRLVTIELNWDDPDPAVMEARAQQVAAALVPQRDDDRELLFRRRGMPLQLVRYRPIALSDELDAVAMLLRQQTVALQCADPRIYSAQERVVAIPVTPAGATAVTVASATNAGNASAYPVLHLDNRDVVDVVAASLVNATAGVAFEVAGVIGPGASLVGDMPAWITAAARSVVTLDGQAVYGMWAPPREPFFLLPGVNALYLQTVPEGANVSARIEYRDTSAS